MPWNGLKQLVYKLNWGFLQNGKFFPLNSGYILEDSNDFFYPMAQMLILTIQTSSFVDMLTCSGEVQPPTASFIISQQLKMEANIHPTEIPLHSIVNIGTMAVDQARFPLVTNQEMSEIKNTAASRNTTSKTWMAAWAELFKKPETLMY